MKINSVSNTFKITNISNLVSNTISDKITYQTEQSYEMLFVEKECVEITSSKFNGTLSTNQMLLISPNQEYTICGNANKKPYIIRITFESKAKQLGLLELTPITIPISIQNHLYRCVKEYSFIISANNEKTLSPFCAKQLLFQNLEYFFIMLIRKRLLNIDFNTTTKYPSFQKNDLAGLVADYIDKHICENITNQQICKEFCVNRTTLCKSFMEAYNVTLIKYINQAKIQVAKTLIREGKMNFTEIANYLSFSSIHYFCKTFIKYENMTPTEYSKTISSCIDKNKN